MSLKDKNIVYLDSIIDTLDDPNDITNQKNCPINSMSSYLNNDGRTFDYNKINHLIPNIDYRNTLGNNSNMSFSNVTQCGGDFSGCCVIQTDFCNNTSDYFDYCDTNNGIGTSTGFIYKNNDSYYNVCHKEKIQDKVNMFSNYKNKKDGLEKFLMVLLATIIVIVFYTFISLPYEFWLRYGNSIQCIYYKIADTCTNMGSKKSDYNDKLTIIEYKFPDNLHNFPYEACEKGKQQSGGMKGGREKEGAINSNYIEYHNNGSKCINVDFGGDEDNYNSKQFTYNIGDYANDKIKNPYVAMMLKGFSFYFLFTVLFIRKILNVVLSFLSKQYQKIYEKSNFISSILLIVNFILTPFFIIGVLISIIFGIMAIFPSIITIMDFVKSLNIFKEDIETSPSTLNKNSDYYKIYNFDNMFYSLQDNLKYDENSKIPKEMQKILDFVKKLIANLFLIIPAFFIIIATFLSGMVGSMLAGLYMVLNILYNFYITSYSNSIEFLDLLRNHSKLLTIILLLTVITSSAVSGLGQQVTGILGGLFGLYLLYELYKLSK